MKGEHPKPECCELCGRPVVCLTRHHLIPRTRHHNRRNKREFDRSEVHTRVAWLCRPCHDHIHAAFSEKTLERDYNTLERLRNDPEVARFVDWIARKPGDFRPPMGRRSRKRR